MSWRTPVEGFFVPLIRGEDVEVGLPLLESVYEALPVLEAGASPFPLAAKELWRRARLIWGRMPRVRLDEDDLLHALLLHDIAAATLHPITFLPIDRWAVRLERRLAIRGDELLRPDAARLLKRHVATEALLDLSRTDAWVRFRYLGTLRAQGRALEWARLPWRVVADRGVDELAISSALPEELRTLLAEWSPLTDLGGPLDRRLRRLTPALACRPLARHLLRHPPADVPALEAAVPRKSEAWAAFAQLLRLEEASA